MLIRAIVGSQIKMLKAAKQSPGQDANIFMLIPWDEGIDGEKNKKLLCSVS